LFSDVAENEHSSDPFPANLKRLPWYRGRAGVKAAWLKRYQTAFRLIIETCRQRDLNHQKKRLVNCGGRGHRITKTRGSRKNKFPAYSELSQLSHAG